MTNSRGHEMTSSSLLSLVLLSVFICGEFSPHDNKKNAWWMALRILSHRIWKNQNDATWMSKVAILLTDDPMLPTLFYSDIILCPLYPMGTLHFCSLCSTVTIQFWPSCIPDSVFKILWIVKYRFALSKNNYIIILIVLNELSVPLKAPM
jgi:hypothetical protein